MNAVSSTPVAGTDASIRREQPGLDRPASPMLSHRAREQIPPTPFNVIWEVLKDPWDAHMNPQGFVNVGVAENCLMQAELAQYLSESVQLCGCDLTYQAGPAGSQRLRAALARFLNRHLNPHKALDSQQVVVTNGVTSALEHTSWALANPGDAFLLGRPFYGAVNLALRFEVHTLAVSFGQTDPMSLAAVACYEEALTAARQQGTTVRGLLLCSPHNPLGQCYARDVLVAYLRLCSKHRIHLVCDEIYALSVWRNPPFVSVLSLDLEELIDPSLVHVLWGISKDFGANGWRLGCIVSPSNLALHAALNSVTIYSYVSSIADHVVTQMLNDDVFTDAYLAENRLRLASAYLFATDFLSRHGIRYRPGGHAALFLWVDLGKAYCDRHPERGASWEVAEKVNQALRLQKVYLADGKSFGSESPGMFRIVFAHPREYLEEALHRVKKALERGAF